MKPLTLRSRGPARASQRLNLSGITPQRLKTMNLSEIAKLQVPGIHSTLEIGEYFHVIEGDRERLRFEGDLTSCDYVAGQLSGGEIEVFSSVGHYAGFAMTGGRFTIQGNAEHFAGSGMRDGTLRIEGNAGDFLGGTASGTGSGMRGGTVVVNGSAGLWSAARMRRGTIVIHGDVAEGLAMRMIAGTVICCGKASTPYGCGMRRGTLMFLGTTSQPTEIVGFSSPEPVELTFLPLFLSHLREHLPKELEALVPQSISQMPRQALRSLGDRTHDGLGELLWLRKFLSG